MGVGYTFIDCEEEDFSRGNYATKGLFLAFPMTFDQKQRVIFLVFTKK